MLFSIQFLRFVAAFSVMLHHSSDGFHGHINVLAAGVDVFFVISGFVISYSTKPGETVYEFAAKRFIRVMPMYWLATAACIGFTYLYWKDLPNWEHLIRSVLLIPVLGTHWTPIYFLGWTLVYECAFYGLFGLLMTIAPSRFRPICIAILAALASASIPVPGTDHFLSSDLLLEFVFGMLIAQFLPLIRRVDVTFARGLVALALALFAINAVHYNSGRPISWGVPAALLVLGVIPLEASQLFNWSISKRLGDASYAIYLTHMTVIQWIEEALKRHGYAIKNSLGLTVLVFAIASVIVGVAVNILIEKPMLFVLRQRIMPLVSSARRSLRSSEAAQTETRTIASAPLLQRDGRI
jgi:exopolysaccharide production protein ExoZ